MRILVAVPTFETIRPETFKSIYGLQHYGHTVLFDYVRGYDCARARNCIGQEVIRDGFDAVLMIDSDIVVPSDALKYLTEGDSAIVLGTYPRRFDPKGSELFELGHNDFTHRYMFKDVPHGRFEVKGGGLGCALIRRTAFEKIEYPWFVYVEYSTGDLLSEDNYFCSKAADHGLKVEADSRVRCGHVSAQAIYSEV